MARDGGRRRRAPRPELAPRAYVITPLRSKAVTLAYNYNTGKLLFAGTVPITGATGKLSMPSVSYHRSSSFFGRAANLLAALPYGVGTFEGEVLSRRSMGAALALGVRGQRGHNGDSSGRGRRRVVRARRFAHPTGKGTPFGRRGW
jgi:hypothetical protein